MKLTFETLKKLIEEEIHSNLSEGMYLKYVDNQKYPVRLPDATSEPKELYRLSDEELDRLEELAVDDPLSAGELAISMLGLDDEQEEKEISDYYYDIAIAKLVENSKLVVMIQKNKYDQRTFHIYEEIDGDYNQYRGGRLNFLGDIPLNTPRSKIYKSLQDHIGKQ